MYSSSWSLRTVSELQKIWVEPLSLCAARSTALAFPASMASPSGAQELRRLFHKQIANLGGEALVDEGVGAEQDLTIAWQRELVPGRLSITPSVVYYFYPWAKA